MKNIILIALFSISVLLEVCAAQDQPVKSLSIMMTLQNQDQPFVSESFAKRLALLVIDEKYPKAAFIPREPATIADQGEIWTVTFENALPLPKDSIFPKRLSIAIRKNNGEIVNIS